MAALLLDTNVPHSTDTLLAQAILNLRLGPIDSVAGTASVLAALATPIAGQFVVCMRGDLHHRPLPPQPPQLPSGRG